MTTQASSNPRTAPPWFPGAVMVLLVLVLGSFIVWGDKNLTPSPAQSADIPPAQGNAAPAPGSPPASPSTSQPATEPAPKPPPSIATQVGIDDLNRELGITSPMGRNINVAHVEGNLGDYLPNGADPRFQPMQIVPRSGPSKANGHTQATAALIYGSKGHAPGIAQAHFFVTNHWLNFGCLNLGSIKPPDPGETRISTHSWIGTASPNTSEILRRLDYMIDTHDVLAVVGVNNGNTSEVPALLGSAYNVIAVGHPAGNSSGGYTKHEVAGRCKPDLVAPGGLTSFTTPVVTAVVARLMEAADRRADVPQARRSEVLRALLLAGAQKPTGWKQATGRPLDERLGAGMVRIDQSYQILTDGPLDPGPVPPRGWSYLNMAPGSSKTTMKLQLLSNGGEVSIIATWNRRIDGRVVKDFISGQDRWMDTPRLGQFHLILERIRSDGTIDTVAESTSRIDNVQHVYRPFLPAGRYRIQVIRMDDLPEDYEVALAWRIEPENKP